jgi:hypothetical protein
VERASQKRGGGRGEGAQLGEAFTDAAHIEPQVGIRQEFQEALCFPPVSMEVVVIVQYAVRLCSLASPGNACNGIKDKNVR